MVRWITRLLATMGGEVRIDPDGENLCRRARDGETAAFVVEAQGVPNLVHELVHALFLGRLDDDHGFDYGLIPLDLALPEHRRHVWEELACCVISVAYGQLDPDVGPDFALDWFVEQFEIQGVFHGLEGDLPGFRARIDRALADPRLHAELEAVVQQGYELVAKGLTEVGSPSSVYHLNDVPTFDGLWRAYRGIWRESPTSSG